MAAESEIPGEIQAHQSSYSRFIWMMKWGAVVTMALTFIVILLIS